jgi:hypothetical protein
MKNLITLCLILLGVAAQAQRDWHISAFADFTENARIVGAPTDNASIKKYMDESMLRCYTYPQNPTYTKEGYQVARKINVYKVAGKHAGAFYHAWEWVVTVDLVQGNSPSEIKLKQGKDTLTYVSCNYMVPQHLKPKYKLVHYTKKEMDKADPSIKQAIKYGLLNRKPITKADLTALGFK